MLGGDNIWRVDLVASFSCKRLKFQCEVNGTGVLATLLATACAVRPAGQ